ncbi:MAG TPA: adenylyltransferase/cytidyltransferase family protein [Anaerolineae bacterium]|nr:adenylyltransferase/cytidyltransferase family protein [Anaerolineae bacterium]
MNPKRFDRIGMVARWKPVHLGHLAVLHALCEQADHALIGIGSANRYNARNPFTLEETTDMLRLALAGYDNYTLVPVPDLDDGPRWRLMLLDLFGPLDAFVTANPYVAHLMMADYPLLKPVALVTEAHRMAVDGAAVRREMARSGDWQALVPPEIARYIVGRQLDERFRREFGLETLALETVIGRQ